METTPDPVDFPPFSEDVGQKGVTAIKNDRMTLKDKLQTLLDASYLKPPGLAAKVEMSESTVRRWLDGEIEPSMANAVKIAHEFKISLRRLVYESEDLKPDDIASWDWMLEMYLSRLGAEGICSILMDVLAERAKELSRAREANIPDLVTPPKVQPTPESSPLPAQSRRRRG